MWCFLEVGVYCFGIRTSCGFDFLKMMMADLLRMRCAFISRFSSGRSIVSYRCRTTSWLSAVVITVVTFFLLRSSHLCYDSSTSGFDHSLGVEQKIKSFTHQKTCMYVLCTRTNVWYILLYVSLALVYVCVHLLCCVSVVVVFTDHRFASPSSLTTHSLFIFDRNQLFSNR